MYKDIVESLGFIHNLCLFHLIKDLKDILKKKMKNKKIEDNIKTKYWDEINCILFILRQKKYRKAKNEFKKFLKRMNNIPEDLREFVNQKIKPNFESYMKHTQYERLPATNNQMENYFGTTLPRHLKKIYKTEEGIEMYLDLQRTKYEKNYGKIITTMEFLT